MIETLLVSALGAMIGALVPVTLGAMWLQRQFDIRYTREQADKRTDEKIALHTAEMHPSAAPVRRSGEYPIV